MKKTKIFSGLVFFLLASFIFPQTSSSDGGLIPLPSRHVYETGQKAVIFHENGIENMIISPTYQGNSENFAWIIPTPGKPEVEKSIESLFTSLNDFTQPRSEYSGTNLPGGSYLSGSADFEKGVSVIETKKIDYYDITVLEATDVEALYEWLNDNGYFFPQAGKYIADEYIEKEWYFTAIKITDEMAATLKNSPDNNSSYPNTYQPYQSQPNYGSSRNLIPLKLKFASDQVVYPLKISSLAGIDDNSPTGTVSYIEGQSGKAVQIDSDKILGTDSVIPGFDASNSKITFYLKKRSGSNYNFYIAMSSANNVSTNNNNFTVQSSGESNIYLSILTKNMRYGGVVELGSDLKNDTWQKYEFIWSKSSNNPNEFSVSFSIDDVIREVKQNYNGSNPSYSNDTNLGQNASLTLGGYRNIFSGPNSQPTISYQTSKSSDMLIDNLSVNSNNNSIFKAGFDDNLKVELADGKTDIMRVFQNGYVNPPITRNYTLPTSMDILLYVFSDQKVGLPGFDTQYASWVLKDDIENLARIDGKIPWITPKGDHFFLTRLHRTMSITEMTEDLYPKASVDQYPFNAPISDDSKKIYVFLLILAMLSLTAGAFIYAIRRHKLNLNNN